jgi:TPR repeat protein
VNWVEAEVEVALSRAAASSFPFIPIIAKESEGSKALPPFARLYQGVLDPFNDADELAKLIKAVTGDWDRQVILTGEPFVGLRAMDESWANRFFGRKGEVRELVEKFKKHRLIAIVADSGAGKSSLAQAGLIPAFRGGALADESREEPDDRIWHVAVMRPGSDPLQGLKDGLTDAARLLGLSGAEQSQLRSRLNISDPGESAYALRCDLDRKQTETLLVVDQFEELLIQTPEEKRAPFADFLCALADGPFGFRILLTLRADYFSLDDSLQQLRLRLWADGQDAVFRLKRMSSAALAETAREPLALAGFKDKAQVEALIQAIQRDVSDRAGDLALVQMALHSVWRRHKTRSEDLLQAYAEVQGVSGALAHEAEQVRGRLSDARKVLLFPILARLIRRGELGSATRRMAQRDEFDAEKQRLIAHLSGEEGGRLLLAGASSVEIAHEALITQWPWLRTEGQKYASDIEELARLMEKANAWAKQAANDRPKYLATGAELETFSALAERRTVWLSNNEREFVGASRAAHAAGEKRRADEAARLKRQAVRLRVLVFLLVIAMLGAVGAAMRAQSEKYEAEEQKKEADQILKGATNIIIKFQHELDDDIREQVFAVFQTGAIHGDAGSMRNLGQSYRYGLGVTQDYAKAREWYGKAAGGGSASAMAYLGNLYDNGEGVTQDYAKAREWYEKAAGKGDETAMFYLGVLYGNGHGVAQDYAKAREWYEKAAGKGDETAMSNLGVLYANGQGVAQDYAKAREWYEKAAGKGDAIAMSNLGFLYQDGHSVAQDYAQAREWWEKAAAKSNPTAMRSLGWLYDNGHGVPQNYAKAREWYEKAADKGDETAMSNLGVLYANGQGVAQDYAKAREWYEKAAGKGDETAMSNLGVLYADGHGVAQDYATAREWYEKAAGKGDATGMSSLGALYENGHGVAQDYAKARELFEKAADKGDALAMSNLGVLYMEGHGVPQDYAKARELLEKAAEKGSAEAMSNLAALYQNGLGVEQDYGKARELLEKAAEKGVAMAQANLAVLYIIGQGVPQDEAKARELLEKAKASEVFELAADQGDAMAMLNLGVLYQLGYSVEQDYNKAREWYEKAAEQGVVMAMVNLGALYTEGQGVTQDYAKARKLFEKAAEKGVATAMVNLGVIYENGWGVPQDYAKAREWYEKAAGNGEARAAALLDDLAIEEAVSARHYDEALRLCEALEAKREDAETKRDGKPGKETARALSRVAWQALFARDFTKALIESNRAHELFPDNLSIETNRAHAFMFLGSAKDSTALYLAYKGKPMSEQDQTLWERAIAKDFAELRKAGLKHPMMASIEKKLGVSR